MKKIILEEGQPLPKVVHRDGYIFENAKGGPYKYGSPIYLDKVSLARRNEL